MGAGMGVGMGAWALDRQLIHHRRVEFCGIAYGPWFGPFHDAQLTESAESGMKRTPVAKFIKPCNPIHRVLTPGSPSPLRARSRPASQGGAPLR